ncbi:LysR family transcriptional regulator [Rhodococcus qingshengii]
MKPANSDRKRAPVADSMALPSSDRAPRALLDLHRVTQFEAVARHLNITRAANELYLSQQAVSASIKSLERELGVRLLERVGRRLELTPSGTVLRGGAASLLDAASALTRRIHDAQRERNRPLAIAFTPDVTADDIADLATSAQEALPQTSITARQISPAEIRGELRSGHTDVALTRGISEADDLVSSIIGHTPLTVAVAREHRLSDCGTISLSELGNDALALPGGADNPYARFLVALCHQAGLDPATVTPTFQGAVPTAVVIGTPYYALVTLEPGSYHRGRVAVLAVSPAPIAPLHALWLPHTDNPHRLALLEVHRTRRAPAGSARRPRVDDESSGSSTKPVA